MLLAIALILIGLLAAVLAFPAGMIFHYANGDKTWTLVVAGLRISLTDRFIRWIGRRLHNRRPVPPEDRGKFKRKMIEKLKDLSEGPGSAEFDSTWEKIEDAWYWGRRLLRHVRVRVLRFDAVIATPDPALTGTIYGWSCAAVAILPPHWPITLELDFERDRPAFAFDIELVATPAKLLGVYFHYLWEELRQRIGRGVK